MTAQGDTVVFVHGNASTRAIWDGVIAAMPEGMSCVAFDLPGHGARAGEAVTGFATFTDALEAALSGLGPVNLVGHSLGGLIAADVARRHPGRVATLGLLATPVDRTRLQLSAAAAFVERVERDGLFESLSRLKDRWYTDAFARENPDILAARVDQLRGMDADRFLATYRIYIDPDHETAMADLPMPVLLLSGELADGFDPAYQRKLAGRHAHVTCRLYPGIKNGVLTECPARVAADLATFIAAHAPQTNGAPL